MLRRTTSDHLGSTESIGRRDDDKKGLRRLPTRNINSQRRQLDTCWLLIGFMAVLILADILYLSTLSFNDSIGNDLQGNASSTTFTINKGAQNHHEDAEQAMFLEEHQQQRGAPIADHPDQISPDEDHDDDKGPIFEILRQAGMDPDQDLTEEEVNSLPTWSRIEELYGNEAKIWGLERCEEFREATDPRIRFFGMSGTFNSGTNLIAQLLIENCQITERMLAAGNQSKGIRWQVPWGKHYPAYRRESHVTRTDADVPVANSLPIVTIRDPYQWAQSMCRHKYALYWRHTKMHCPNLVPTKRDKIAFEYLKNETLVPVTVKYSDDFQTNHDSLFHLYNEWYNLYFNATFPRIMVRFEDLLFRGKEITETVCACGGGVPREDRPPGFEHISQSAKLGTAAHGKDKTNLLGALVKYGTDKHRTDSMTPEDLRAAQQILDPKLMQAFGYEHPIN